jgi:hypothetical protein
MDSELENKKFFFGEQAAGYFQADLPSSSGDYPYMPFRGPGHYKLTGKVASSGSAQCYYLIGNEKRHFSVSCLKATAGGGGILR